MLDVLASIGPVFAIIALGYALKRMAVFGDSLWDGIETLTFRLLLPALLVLKLGGTDLSGYDYLPMAAGLFGATAIVTVALTLARPVSGMGAPAYTSVLQGAIRQNSYIGLAAAAPLYGPQGVALAAVGIAAVIPFVNAVSVWVMNRLLAGTKPSAADLARRMLANPIIIGCLLGFALNASGVGIPEFAAKPLGLLAGAALPLGLLAVGAGLDLATVRRDFARIALASALKLIAVPVLTFLVCRQLGAGAVSTRVAVLFASLPSSGSSYVFSRQLGGDAELMAAILTTQVILAAVTIPLMIAAFG